jgi:hypothetical protein
MKKYKIPKNITEIIEKDGILYCEIKTLIKEEENWIVKTTLTPLEELKYIFCGLKEENVDAKKCCICVFWNNEKEKCWYNDWKNRRTYHN